MAFPTVRNTKTKEQEMESTVTASRLAGLTQLRKLELLILALEYVRTGKEDDIWEKSRDQLIDFVAENRRYAVR